MDSYKKETHRYAFELVKAAREMAVDIAEKLPHLQEIRSNYQAEALKIRIKKTLIKQRLLLRVLFHQKN